MFFLPFSADVSRKLIIFVHNLQEFYHHPYMSIEEKQKQTTVNVQEKANLIWAIADKLVGVYKPHEYGNVILPMCVVKRFEDTLAPTKQKVLDMNKQLDADGITVKQGFLEKAAGQKFYNLSPFTFETLLSDPENIRENFESYLNHFSENVIDVIHRMKFQQEIETMAENGLLYLVIKEFCTEKAYLGADKVSSVDMGYIFEELVRKFSESYDEHAGAHFTARDIINLMTELLVGEDEERLEEEGITATIYDMAMGTSQMLGCMSDRLLEIDPDADITTYGQELNEQTFAIAKADTLIKGGNADNMRQGDTLGDDKFDGYKFDYIISNPPFGIEWKTSRAAVEAEHKKGAAGRFEPGLPAIGDGQQLFLLNGVAKLKDTGRMAIIQNGSPLFKGDAGSGESNIRGYLLENDWLEAIVQLPNDLFYNTGIATYIWVITRNKSAERQGKVQLIDASQCYEKRRKPLGNKRVEITETARQLIMQAYDSFSDGVLTQTAADGTEIRVESKVRENDYFKYSKLFIMNPELDSNGNVVYDSKGRPVIDKSLNDTEIIPWLTDRKEYLLKNVVPYSPHCIVDEKKTKIGYEIPFTREFYKYTPLKPSADIFEELKALEQQEAEMMNKILH